MSNLSKLRAAPKKWRPCFLMMTETISGKHNLAPLATKTLQFTETKTEKARYLNRHKNNENWKNPFSAGALSRWILWNKKSLAANIRDYKERFGFD